MSLSVSSMRASRSICSSLNFWTYWDRPHAVRNRSKEAYPDSSPSPSSSDVIVELSVMLISYSLFTGACICMEQSIRV